MGAAAGREGQEITERRPNREIRENKEVDATGGVGGGGGAQTEQRVWAGRGGVSQGGQDGRTEELVKSG